MAKSQSKRSRSLSPKVRRKLSDLAKARPRRADGRFKKSPARKAKASYRNKSKSKSKASRSLSAKTRRRLSDLAKKRPRRADGKFKKSPKKSRSTSRSRKTSRFTNEEYRELFHILGIRNSKYAKQRLHEEFKDAYLEAILDGYVQPQMSYQMSPIVQYQVSALGYREPTLSSVLDHFYYSAPERLGCTKEVCVKALERFEAIAILPKSPEDLKLIIINSPSEQRSINARCWVCLYKSYREVFYQLNGTYPAADVDFEFVEQLIGTTKDEQSGERTDQEVSDYMSNEFTRALDRKQKADANRAYLAALDAKRLQGPQPSPASTSPSASLLSSGMTF